MAKERSKLADYLVYLAVRVVVCVIQMMSYRLSCYVARGLAGILYRVDRRHRLVADENLSHAFPDLDAGERDQMVRAVYLHFCTLLMVIIHLLRKLHPSNWKQHLNLISGREMVDALLSGRPIMLVTGHFGNWELGGFALGLFGFQTHAIARVLDNPYLERYLRRFREQTGQTILDKNGKFTEMQELLDNGGVMATLGDQDAGQRGQFVDFFGRPASTHKAIAVFSLHNQVPLVVLGIAQVGEPMRHALVVEDVIRPEEYASERDPVRAITQRFTSALERIIRRHPEQYFWLHRRWKHQPAQKKAKKVA
jgi:KDO2-lipid IV(A) lauroyltransferase